MPVSPRLSRRIKPKDRTPLVTLDDARAYMAALPDEIARKQVWKDAAALALDVRMAPSREGIGALTKQIELALITTDRLDLP